MLLALPGLQSRCRWMGKKMGQSEASPALFLLGIGKLVKTSKNPHFHPVSPSSGGRLLLVKRFAPTSSLLVRSIRGPGRGHGGGSRGASPVPGGAFGLAQGWSGRLADVQLSSPSLQQKQASPVPSRAISLISKVAIVFILLLLMNTASLSYLHTYFQEKKILGLSCLSLC